MSDMTPGRTRLLRNLYEAFDRREFEMVLALMRPDLKWANGMEGGFVYGRDAVREYWRRQFEVTQSHLEPLGFETDGDGRDIATVHLVVRDRGGNRLAERTVQQIFTFEDGLISLFEIAGAGPLRPTDTADGR